MISSDNLHEAFKRLCVITRGFLPLFQETRFPRPLPQVFGADVQVRKKRNS